MAERWYFDVSVLSEDDKVLLREILETNGVFIPGLNSICRIIAKNEDSDIFGSRASPEVAEDCGYRKIQVN